MKTMYIGCTAEACRKTFRNEVSLQKHLEEEHIEGESKSIIGYRCKKCKRVLGTKQSLKEHFYTHTGQKPYRCTEPGCKMLFRQSSQLSYHKKIHTEVKKYFNLPINDHQKETQTNEMMHESLPVDQQAGIPMDLHYGIVDLITLPLITGPCMNIRLPNIFKNSN